jgi:hypothetical protein
MPGGDDVALTGALDHKPSAVADLDDCPGPVPFFPSVSSHTRTLRPYITPDQQQEKRLNMTNLEQLGALLFDAVVNLDPQEFEAIAGTAGRLKTEGSLHEVPGVRDAVWRDRARRDHRSDLPHKLPPTEAELPPSVRKADPAEDAGTHLRAVTGRPERRNIQNPGRRHSDASVEIGNRLIEVRKTCGQARRRQGPGSNPSPGSIEHRQRDARQGAQGAELFGRVSLPGHPDRAGI